MAIKFLYLDDEDKNTATGLVTQLDDKENLIFDVQRPVTWNQQKDILIEKKNLNNYDGLLLDLKLEFSEGEDNAVKFSGADLAQSIRSDVKAGKVKDLPIFLCSTNDNFMAFFDRTSIDLFDNKYKKEQNLNTEETKCEFISFAQAYQELAIEKNLENIVKKTIKEVPELEVLKLELANCQTPHETIYLLNRHVIQSEGILITEQLLSIRLGIDVSKSADWKKFLDEVLSKFRYQGILEKCYNRWWQVELIKWWQETFQKSLVALTAQQKVEKLKEKYGLDLTPLSLPDNQNYTTFWYKCRLSDTALDPTDGLRTIEMPRYVWQEPTYISLNYLLSDERDREKISLLLGPNEKTIFEDLDK